MNNLLIIALTGWKFFILGVDVEHIQEGSWAMVAAGAGSSLISHSVGHLIYSGPKESVGYGRAGFALQSIIGLALTGFKATRESSFTKGWVIGTDLKLALYHQWHKDWGDFGTIEDQGGNRKRDYNAFCAIAVYNTLLNF